MNSVHIKHLTPLVLRFAQITRELLPVAKSIQTYQIEHGISDDDAEELLAKLDPGLKKQIEDY